MANNGKIKGGSQNRLANDPSTPAPLFNFYAYETGKTYYNNPTRVDFVTHEGNLYVCSDPEKYASESTPERNGGFLLIVKKGEDGKQGLTGKPGANGETPEIKARFEGKQLVIYDAHTQTRLSSSAELVGPTWKPVLVDNKLTWKLEEGTPNAIDLDELRPKEERPVLFRLNSDNTKRSDEETGPGYYIQWKREGNQEWTDLMSISELMNIALAGVSFWWADDESGATDSEGDPIRRLHFGHRQVVRATYDASKLGNKRIAEVELGEVLFDAGEIPMPSYDDDINALNALICDLQNDIAITRELIPTDYVKSVNGHLPNSNGNVTIDIPEQIDAYTKAQADAKFLTEHQSIKKLNGQTLTGTDTLYVKRVNDQALISTIDESIYVGTVRSIKVNNNDPVSADNNGMVTLNIEGAGGTVDAYTKTEADNRFQPKGNYVKSVKVNGTSHTPNASTGEVDLGTLNGDTSDCVKSVKINGTTHTPTNGLVDLGTVGGNGGGSTVTVQSLINSGTQIATITIDGTPIALYAPNDGTTGGLNRDAVLQLIARVLEGLEDSSITNIYVRAAGDNYFIRKSDLDNYYTKSQVYTKGEIDQMLTGTVPHNRTFMIFKRSDSNVTETLPSTTITWNVSTGVLDIPNGSNGWTEHPENASAATPYLWVAYATFESLHGERVGNWDGPFCLTGENGQDGEDGKGVEFIYHLGPKGANGARPTAPTINYTKSKDYNTTPATTNDNRTKAWWATEASEDWCPGDGNNGYWTDNPSGVDEDENKQVEWAAVRKSHYDSENDITVWEDFCSPFIWSMWGEDGVDGDGVEYLFCVTATEAEMEIFRNLIPIKGQTYNDFDTRFPNYQTSDWYPKDGQGNANKWTDNPLSVSTSQPYEWVAIRKKDGATGLWSYFSEPKVWGLWGQKTVYQTTSDIIYNNRPYTCYAFTRSVDDLTTRVVKTTWEYNNQTYAAWIAEDPTREADFYDNPLDYIITLKPKANTQNEWEIDANIVWHDSIPEGTSPAEDLYLITNLIGDEDEEETAWDGPVRWGDSVGFQTEYAAATTETTQVYNKQKTLPRLDTYETADPSLDPDGDGINEAAWRTAVQEAGMGVWKDDNSIVNPVYMATCYKKANGYWSAWTVTKVKGENGTDGRDGTDGADGQNGLNGNKYEYVYYRTNGETPLINKTYGTYSLESAVTRTRAAVVPETEDFFPAVDNVQSLRDGSNVYWTDHPQGVGTGPNDYSHEWMAFRERPFGASTFESFSDPILWSQVGAKGRDGDGVEYVFFSLTSAQHELVKAGITVNSVNYNGKLPVSNADVSGDIAHGNHTRNEFLPYSVAINSTLPAIRAVDDNPGGNDTTPYVYCSMRRFDGDTGEWGDFGPASLWVDVKKSATDLSCTIHYSNDMVAVFVDDNYTPKSSYLSCNTDVDMRHGTDLIRPATVWVDDTKIIETSFDNATRYYSGTYNPTSGSELTYGGVKIKRATFSYGERSYGYLSLELELPTSGTNPFDDNSNVGIPFTFKSDSQGSVIYEGTGVFYLNPTTSENPYHFVVLTDPIVYKPSENSTDYTPTTLSFSTANEKGYWMSAEEVQAAVFKVSFDGGTATSIPVTSYWTSFASNKKETPGTLLANDSYIYGNYPVSGTPFTVTITQEVAKDCHAIDDYSVGLQINLTSENLSTVIKSTIECYIGTSSDSEQDYQKVSVVYPGSQGNKGDTVQDAYFLTAVYDEGAGSWATWFDNIRNGVSGYSWVPGELGQKWTVNIGTSIQTDTPVTLEQPTMTPVLKYLWKTSRTVTYIGNTPSYGTWSVPVLESQTGPQGDRGETIVSYGYFEGKVLRLSNWSDPQLAFYAGETEVNGVKYLDIVKTVWNNETKYFKCIADITYSSMSDKGTDIDDKPSWQGYWSEFTNQPDSFFETLLANSAYIENLTVKNLNTAGEDNSILERIAASGNTMYMTDSAGAQRFVLTGDSISLQTPATQYPMESLRYSNGFSRSGNNDANGTASITATRLYGPIVISSGDSLNIPNITIETRLVDGHSGTSEGDAYTTVTIGTAIYKNNTLYRNLRSGTIEDSDSIVLQGITVSDLPAGTYTVVISGSVSWGIPHENTAGSITLYVDSTNDLSATVTSSNSNNNLVQIGANGLSIHLGNSFDVIFALDNGSPLIQMQGMTSGGNIVGLRITSSGLEKNIGSGWVSL